MKKFIPYEKLSPRKKKELDREKRGSWGAINPVTRKSANPAVYDRKREARRLAADDFGRDGFFMLNYMPQCSKM